MVYQTDGSAGFYYHTGSEWKYLPPAAIASAAQPINSISSFIFRRNKELDYSNAIIKYVNLKNDTTLIETENRKNEYYEHLCNLNKYIKFN